MTLPYLRLVRKNHRRRRGCPRSKALRDVPGGPPPPALPSLHGLAQQCEALRELLQERIFRKIDGRKVALIPIPARLENGAPVMVRSGEKASSVVRIHRAELLCDPDRDTGTVAPIDINA